MRIKLLLSLLLLVVLVWQFRAERERARDWALTEIVHTWVWDHNGPSSKNPPRPSSIAADGDALPLPIEPAHSSLSRRGGASAGTSVMTSTPK